MAPRPRCRATCTPSAWSSTNSLPERRPFQASSLAEFHRKQTETNPTPPSSVVKNFDPAVERAILRCLDRDPSQRPRSALSVAAALPGGDPLAAALAAGETPSPEMVAAAGPAGSLRPAVAWACLAATIVLILGTSVFLAPRDTDWGLIPMNKSPEVLADRAQELAKKLGYSAVVDRAFWIGSETRLPRLCCRIPVRQGLETHLSGASMAVAGWLLVPPESAVDDAVVEDTRGSPNRDPVGPAL